MDIKTITATLALLGSGTILGACDSAEKPATEVGAEKAKAGDAAAKDKVEAKTDEAANKAEMSCAEGKCAAGGCGGKKHDEKDEGKKAFADGEKKDAPAEPPADPEKADKS